MVKEGKEIERVIERLGERNPDLAETEIRDVVDEAHHGFDGARVRKFVPLLVERAAKEEFRARREIDLTDEVRLAASSR